MTNTPNAQDPKGGPRAGALASIAKRCPLPKWTRRLGAAAFLFFLIKGLMWLIVPAVVVWWSANR